MHQAFFHSPGAATAMCTVPTGFSSLPPLGPAIPVMPTPNVLPHVPPDSFRQRDGHFAAHRAFCLNQFGAAHPPTRSSFHCCSKPLRRENSWNCPESASNVPPAIRPCSFPPPQSSRDWSIRSCATTSSSEAPECAKMRSPNASSKLRTISSSVVFACAASSLPTPQMNLYFSGRRQDRRVHVVVSRVDRPNALFHMRFTQAPSPAVRA